LGGGVGDGFQRGTGGGTGRGICGRDAIQVDPPISASYAADSARMEKMNTDESILAELRKIAAWADRQRKMTKWSLIFLAVFVPAMIVFAVVMEHREKASREAVAAVEKHDWYDVDRNIRICNLAEAIRIGEELIQKTPQYPRGHCQLAAAYVAAGKIREARAHYAEAVRLFPCEEYKKLLIAIDKRITTENPQPSDKPKRASPRR
jgi:cytochrome c-type biogenesis protein CcmH/NrfG